MEEGQMEVTINYNGQMCIRDSRYTRFNHQAGAVQKLDFDGLQIDLENRSVTTENGTFELPPKEFDLLLYRCV